MFEQPPTQREWVSWLAVALWSGLIFATIPLARAIQRAVEGSVGAEGFLYAVLLAIAAAIGAAVRQLRQSGRVSPGRAAWLIGVALFYAGYVYHLRDNPEEAVHFVEYGVLGLLAFRAFTHRMRDPLIYLAAAIVGGIVGILDEAIQWATPERVWDLRDVWFNFVGAAAIQVGIALGIRPSLIAGSPTAGSVRILCRTATAAVLLLTASLLNTPPRIAWYSAHVPGLAFLRERPDVMLEYGHLYEAAEVGRFRSRLAPAELARTDRERGVEAGRILASAPDDAYADFLARYTPISDPFLHEARVHLFRRDRYLATAEKKAREGRGYGGSLTVAYRENRILEVYFPHTLEHSGRAWPEERRAALAEQQLAGEPYESRVSRGLVTRVGEGHVVAGCVAALLLLFATDRAAGRRMRDR